MNSAGLLNDWTLTVARTGQTAGHDESTGQTESYTLTCEKPDGTVVATRSVTVARGQRLDIGKACRYVLPQNAAPPPARRAQNVWPGHRDEHKGCTLPAIRGLDDANV